MTLQTCQRCLQLFEPIIQISGLAMYCPRCRATNLAVNYPASRIVDPFDPSRQQHDYIIDYDAAITQNDEDHIALLAKMAAMEKTLAECHRLFVGVQWMAKQTDATWTKELVSTANEGIKLTQPYVESGGNNGTA